MINALRSNPADLFMHGYRFSELARRALSIAVLCAALGCDAMKTVQDDGTDPHADPLLPPPRMSVLPTVHVAHAVGWPLGITPHATGGLQVHAFAAGLSHPRWLYVLPNGDVLVAETNAPERTQHATGLRGWFMRKVMDRAGATPPSANRITLLRDTDGDGVADFRATFRDGLNSPFGMALVGDAFYVANTDALLRFDYQVGMSTLSGAARVVTELPAGPINHHWTKNILPSADGSKMYVSVGSNSNVGENGLAVERDRASILEVDLQTGVHRVFASGLRNPNGMAWAPPGQSLWTVVNERDELGDDLVPDYLTRVRDGGFYGWPFSYFGRHVDPRVDAPRPALLQQAIMPDYALGAHTASLGLAFGPSLTEPRQLGMFIGQHGSWNRRPFSGYQVVFVPFSDSGAPSGAATVVLNGFLGDRGQAYGRPVGVALDHRAGLLVADDVGNTVWRVSRPAPTNADSAASENHCPSPRQ